MATIVERAARLVVNVAAVLGVVVAIGVIAALAYGVRPLVFVSGSMSPTITTGALALIKPVKATDIEHGDIISVTREDGTRVTHRVVELTTDADRTTMLMQGDANKAPDAETYDVTHGADQVMWHINGMGHLVTGAKAPIAIACAGALLLIALWPGRRTTDPDTGSKQEPAMAEPRSGRPAPTKEHPAS